MTAICRCCHQPKPFTYEVNEFFSEAFCRRAFVCDQCRDRWEAKRTQPKINQPKQQLAARLPYIES